MSLHSGNAGKPVTEKTAFAVLVSILLVIPALIPAAVVVVVYTFFLGSYVQHSWVPYLDEIALQWFPELLRGLIAGAIALGLTSYLFKNCNLDAVRYATMAFWGGATLLMLVFSISIRGLTFDLIGATAMIVGLALGVWSSKLT